MNTFQIVRDTIFKARKNIHFMEERQRLSIKNK